jgi:hypothetical protein
MRIVIKEFQNESYNNCIGAVLMPSTEKFSHLSQTIQEIFWEDLTVESFKKLISDMEEVAEKEGLDFIMEINKDEVINEIEDTNRELISLVEDGGYEVINYPVDESQTISNAGDAVQYTYEGKRYEIITWNENADEHDPESKTISEMGD